MRIVRLSRSLLHQGPLILVNQAHAHQPEAPHPLTAINSHYPEILLERQAARLLSACITEIHGGGAIVPVSGWRSHAEQQRLWEDTLRTNGEAFTRRYVALPGCSEHETGLAIDLGKAAPEIDFIRPDFPYSGPCQTFRRAALRYGFIERYPREKERITGISHEPWHFRYVGAPHAQLMHENGLCLEEYTEFIRQKERRCALGNGSTAHIFCIPCTGEETVCELPGCCCQISGNNVNGFVVTAWEVGA